MKYLPLFIFTFISSAVCGQLPTIQAVGGEGRSVNWPEIAKNTDTLSAGFFYDDCAQDIAGINASSTLASQGNNTYTVTNLKDYNPMTAWVSGKKGIGEWFEVKSMRINKIYNGYQSTPQNWLDNSRVKTFKVYRNNKPLCYLQLTDEMGGQRFDLPGSDSLSENDTSDIFKFEITDIYKGQKWGDVCISEIQNIGCCFSGSTFINSANDSVSIVNIKNESEILAVDLAGNKTSVTKVEQVTTEKHLSLYRLSTPTKTIELTADHPLNFKNYGFTSISKLLKNSDTTGIINTMEVMTWNDKLKKTEYEKVIHLTRIEGVFDTYTILKIDNGDTYIANGFITKTY
jgi:hypothetical protein